MVESLRSWTVGVGGVAGVLASFSSERISEQSTQHVFDLDVDDVSRKCVSV